MHWAERRKLAYLLLVLFVLGSAIFLLVRHYTKETPTCFDGKKNGDEKGIDCGGGCALYCPDELSDPKVRWVRTFQITPGIVHAIAYIEHNHPDAAARSVSYQFKIYDEKNNIITTRTGTTFLGPMGRTAIVETLIPVGLTVPAITNFSFTAPIKWEKIDHSFSEVVIKSDRTLVEPITTNNVVTGTRLTAVLENQSRFTFNNLDVDAIIYDKNGNAITVSKALVQQLPALGNQTVYFTWPFALPAEIGQIEIIPRTNPYTAS